MKYIYILALLVVSTTSCTNWLDVTPENTVVETELFKEGVGFQNTLNGIFRKLSGSNLYGRELTYGFNEVLSQNYVRGNYGITASNPYYEVAQFSYEENKLVKGMIDVMWSDAYFVIANCNNLLFNIENADPKIFKYKELEKGMIKGEALAVRAMMHFDLLRMYGAAPITKDNKGYIPYLTTFPYYGGQLKESPEDILQKIVKDLTDAKTLVMNYDFQDDAHSLLLTSGSRYIFSLETEVEDVFYNYRGYRLNGVAISAILARVYNYWGRHAEAAQEAQNVIDAEYKGGYWGPEKLFSFGNSPDDRKQSDDLIFTLSEPNLYIDYKPYTVSSSDQKLLLDKTLVQFKGGNSDLGDSRLKWLITEDNNGFIPLKNVSFENGNEAIQAKIADMIPMIRLSEMYFILAESHAFSGNFTQAEAAINEVRKGRNCVPVNFGINNMDAFKKELFIEARKELFQEGQIFFYYKKYNEPLTATMNVSSFILPLPDSEKIN